MVTAILPGNLKVVMPGKTARVQYPHLSKTADIKFLEVDLKTPSFSVVITDLGNFKRKTRGHCILADSYRNLILRNMTGVNETGMPQHHDR